MRKVENRAHFSTEGWCGGAKDAIRALLEAPKEDSGRQWVLERNDEEEKNLNEACIAN
jgi:hypothetical protein